MPPASSFFGRSRSALNRFTTMPAISEDEDLHKTVSAGSAAGIGAGPANNGAMNGPPAAAPYVPRGPLRVPQKTARRSMQSHHMSPYVTDSEVHPPLGYNEKAAALEGSHHETRLQRLMSPWRREHEERVGFDERRRRLRFMILLAVVVVIIIALAVGLPVGLLNMHHHKSSPSGSQQQYPAGSWALNTTLQQTTTACTSNPDTWRCYPYTIGAPATFNWIITPSGGSNSYTISSSDNPFEQTFANQTTSLLDAGQATERLVFSFATNRTVVPSNALTPTDRAANCTYPGTQFEATLWTRRSGVNSTLSSTPTSAGTKFADWPADIEIRQQMNATLGQPRCVDVNGNFIADVQAGSGQCNCLYASFPEDVSPS